MSKSLTHLCLIPLFTDDYRNLGNLGPLLRAAIHSRASALRNTDATAQNVSVKLYIEDILRETFEQTLCNNFINPDEDVIWFHAPPLEKTRDGIYGNLGRQMFAYWDERFAQYQRVTVWDADLFFLVACKAHNLFERFAKLPMDAIGYLFAYPVAWRELKLHWYLTLDEDTKAGGIPLRDLLKMAGMPKFEGDVYYPMGCFWTYPARHFHKHHPDFVNWMRTYAPYFGNDQAIATCWNKKFGIPLLSLNEHLELQSTSIFPIHDKVHLFHGCVTSENEEAFRARLSGV